jgi:colicin import membrane protein
LLWAKYKEMSMADENTGLAVIDIKPEQAPMIYVPNGLEDYLNHIRELAKEVPDVTTKKGRDRIGSLARSVGVSKKAIENPGRAYLKRLKEAVKPAEEELKRFVDACDDISKSILKPRIEWDAEQEHIAAENQMLEWHEEALEMNTAFDKAMAERFESDHEIALLINDKIDRDAVEVEVEKERLRIAHEEELKHQAAEQAKREAEEKIQREREASARREAELKFQAEQAERNRIAAEQKAEQDKKDAADKAEREKQEAIAVEQRKAQETADRIQREAKQKEDARLAEEKRVADEAAKKAADKAHQAEVNNAAIAILTKAGIDAECAKACVIAIIKNQVAQSFLNQQPPIQINY